jgi:hypothetical protein
VIKIPDSIPSVSWCTSQRGAEPPVDRWELFAISRSYMRPEDIFTVDGVDFHISQADQLRASRHILDWQQGVGIVQVDAPKTPTNR